MLILTQRIDIIPNGRKKEFWLNQYDEDFIIRFELFSSEGTFSIPSGTTAAIRGTKPDGNGYSADAVIDGNTVTVEGDQQMTVVSGKAVFELTLYKDGKELNSANFILHIERAPLDKDTPSSKSQTRELVSIEEHADELITAATDINAKASDSEAYAVGTRSGTAVESTDPAYHNNSKYYAESLLGSLAPAFSESAAYNAGDYVVKDGKLYKFTADHAAGAWTGTDAAEAQLAGDVSDLKEDLNEKGFPYSAKNALLDCFNHLAWKDDQGKACIKNLIESILTRFEYPGLLSIQTQKSPGLYNDSLGIYEYNNNIRMIISYPFGELPYKYRLEDKYYDFYPIPVLEGATKIIVTQDSSDIMFGLNSWILSDGHYSQIGADTGWKTSPFEYTLPESQQKLYVTVNIKNTSNTDIPNSQFPTSFVLQFI